VLLVVGTSLLFPASTTSSPLSSVFSIPSNSGTATRIGTTGIRGVRTCRSKNRLQLATTRASPSSIFYLINSTDDASIVPSSSANSGNEEPGKRKGNEAGKYLKNGLKYAGLLGLGYGTFITVRGVQLYLEEGGSFDGFDDDPIQLDSEFLPASGLCFPFNGTIDREEAYYFFYWREELDGKPKREIVDLLTKEGFDEGQLKRRSKEFLINLYLEQKLRWYRHEKFQNGSLPLPNRNEADLAAPDGSTKNTTDGISETLAKSLGIKAYVEKNMTEDEMWKAAKEVLGKDMVSRKEFHEIYNMDEDENEDMPTDAIDLGYEYAKEVYSEYYDVFKELDAQEASEANKAG